MTRSTHEAVLEIGGILSFHRREVEESTRSTEGRGEERETSQRQDLLFQRRGVSGNVLDRRPEGSRSSERDAVRHRRSPELSEPDRVVPNVSGGDHRASEDSIREEELDSSWRGKRERSKVRFESDISKKRTSESDSLAIEGENP